MMSSQPSQTGIEEMLAEWEGQAVHHPGVLFEDSQAEHLAGAEAVAAVASWVAVTGFSGAIGNPAYDAIRSKVIGLLKGWRARFGQEKIDEVKKQLLIEMQKHRKNSKMTDQELHDRIESLFQEIEA